MNGKHFLVGSFQLNFFSSFQPYFYTFSTPLIHCHSSFPSAPANTPLRTFPLLLPNRPPTCPTTTPEKLYYLKKFTYNGCNNNVILNTVAHKQARVKTVTKKSTNKVFLLTTTQLWYTLLLLFDFLYGHRVFHCKSAGQRLR